MQFLLEGKILLCYERKFLHNRDYNQNVRCRLIIIVLLIYFMFFSYSFTIITLAVELRLIQFWDQIEDYFASNIIVMMIGTFKVV